MDGDATPPPDSTREPAERALRCLQRANLAVGFNRRRHCLRERRGSGLRCQWVVPGDPNGEPCEVSVYKTATGCGDYRACRFVSPTAGSCEEIPIPCDVYGECADGHACTTNQHCGQMFTCYAGARRKFCELDSLCDNGLDCKFIGHESHGVCAP